MSKQNVNGAASTQGAVLRKVQVQEFMQCAQYGGRLVGYRPRPQEYVWLAAAERGPGFTAAHVERAASPQRVRTFA